jgi:hypothetical protein
MGDEADDYENEQRIRAQREAVDKLSSTVMQSFPLLMGFVDGQLHEPRWSQHGNMAGRYFCIFTMWVVSQARFTSPSHQDTARKVLEWINSSHTIWAKTSHEKCHAHSERVTKPSLTIL